MLDARKLYVLIGVLAVGYIGAMVFKLFAYFQLLLFFVSLLSGVYIMYYHGYEQGFEEGFQECLNGSQKTESSN